MRENLYRNLRLGLLTAFYIFILSFPIQLAGTDINIDVDDINCIIHEDATNTSIGASKANNEISTAQTELVGGNFTYDGINYFFNVTGNIAEVIDNKNLVRDNLIIPDVVVYNGVTAPVTYIRDRAFADCKTITGTLTLGNNITSIGSSAFSGCTGLTGSLEIPNSVKKIYSSAFEDCTGFNGTLTIGNSVVEILERAFSNCSGFTELILGNSVSYIGNYVFYGCSGLTGTLILPDTGGGVYGAAFQGTRYSELILPSSRWRLGGYAFYTPGTLKKIECHSTTPPSFWMGSPFNYYTIPLYVPRESINDYKTAEVWKEFYDIRAIEGDIEIEEISFNESEIQLKSSEAFQLVAKISPEYATNQSLNWVSSDPHIATVDENGLVTALTPGITIITATTPNGLSAVCKVTINPIPASTVTLNVSDMTLLIGQIGRLTATVSPEHTTDKTTIWASDDEVVATVGEDG
ncbi:MAG: leucine-rich repeat protein, partial [Paramuribaculum sp.]|nr:leucine-rich repeat protein [Paramuribaculum sp.]